MEDKNCWVLGKEMNEHRSCFCVGADRCGDRTCAMVIAYEKQYGTRKIDVSKILPRLQENGTTKV